MRRNGVRRTIGGLVVFAAPGPPGLARVAFVAGRGVGGSVERNSAKRRLREAFSQAPFRTGRDYVVIVRKAVTEVPFEELVLWLEAAVDDEEDG